MSPFLLLAAAVILLCLLLNKLTSRLGIPVLLVFLVLGMVFGSDGLFKIHFEDYRLAEQVCSTALIFIMFYGGFGTNWKTARPVLKRSLLLSTVGIVLTAALTGLFCWKVLHFSFWEGMLVGSVISSTDAASVFSILRSRRLNLKGGSASVLELESGSNDPCAYMLTMLVLSILSGEASGGSLAWMVFAQIVFGVLFGALCAWAATLVLSRVSFPAGGLDTLFVFSIALISYAGASLLGGNGYLSTYIAGIALGNGPVNNKKALVNFFDGVTGLMQMLLFFLLGLLSTPSRMPAVVLPALAIVLFLTFVARPVTVFALLTPFRCPLRQQALIAWSGLRGAASIVFAITAVVSPAYTNQDIFHIVFFIVLFSIAVQGTLLPVMARRLDMIDAHADVMKTFSDYSEEMPVQFVKLTMQPGHPWTGRAVREIQLLPGLLLVVIRRGEERIIPNGDTVLEEGDCVVLSALSIEDQSAGKLTEVPVDGDSEWRDQPLSQVRLGQHKLVAAIQREGSFLIPNGSTVIREGDILIISQL